MGGKVNGGPILTGVFPVPNYVFPVSMVQKLQGQTNSRISVRQLANSFVNLREHVGWMILCLGSIDATTSSWGLLMKGSLSTWKMFEDSLSLICTVQYLLSVTWMKSFMTHRSP